MKLLNKLEIVIFAAIFVSSTGFWAGYAYEFTSSAVRHMAMLVVWHRGQRVQNLPVRYLLGGPTERTVDTKPRYSGRFGRRIVEWLGRYSTMRRNELESLSIKNLIGWLLEAVDKV